MEDISVRLDTIASVHQGIRTGGNDLFIFEIESNDGSRLCRAVNGLGASATLETDLLEPVVYGSDVRRYQRVGALKRLLFPYRNNLPVDEVELREKLPNTWSYLVRNQVLLAARASLKKSGGKWYELVWPRDERWLRQPKLLIRDLAPQPAFAIDLTGTVFLVGGTAVVPHDPELLLPLTAYLNSSFVDALMRRTTPQFRGDFQKFEPQHIQGIPVLSRIFEDPQFGGALGAFCTQIIDAQAAGRVDEARIAESGVDEMLRAEALIGGVVLET